MTKAEELAQRSETEKVTAKTLENEGGQWDREKQAYVFSDGSVGCFTKNAAYRTDASGMRSFDHYKFEVTQNGN